MKDPTMLKVGSGEKVFSFCSVVTYQDTLGVILSLQRKFKKYWEYQDIKSYFQSLGRFTDRQE